MNSEDRQNVIDWYKYMQMGAKAMHSANPNVLDLHSATNVSSEKGNTNISNLCLDVGLDGSSIITNS